MDKKIVVIGAGIMGPDIAVTFAIKGYRVCLVDIKKDIIDAGIRRIRESTELFVEKDIIDETRAKQSLDLISGTDNVEKAIEDAIYVTEAVTERLEVKRELFGKLDAICPKNVILASGTSSISISEIASATKYPERVIGTHWINPAHILPLVEVIKGDKTSEETVQITKKLLYSLGKEPIVCADYPPFLNNGLRFGMHKIVYSLLEKGIATPEDIDKVVKLGFGLRSSVFGPLEFRDLAGVDTLVLAMEYVSKLRGDPSLGPPDILRRKVASGELGIKTGKGFYDYTSIDTKKLMKDRYSKLIDIVKIMYKNRS